MDFVELIKQFVRPELTVVAVVLYFCGMELKSSAIVKDKYIPLVLGIFGILTSGIYILATSNIDGYKDVLMAIFVSITQGLLVAGLSVYANQLIKQIKKEE